MRPNLKPNRMQSIVSNFHLLILMILLYRYDYLNILPKEQVFILESEWCAHKSTSEGTSSIVILRWILVPVEMFDFIRYWRSRTSGNRLGDFNSKYKSMPDRTPWKSCLCWFTFSGGVELDFYLTNTNLLMFYLTWPLRIWILWLAITVFFELRIAFMMAVGAIAKFSKVSFFSFFELYDFIVLSIYCLCVLFLFLINFVCLFYIVWFSNLYFPLAFDTKTHWFLISHVSDHFFLLLRFEASDFIFRFLTFSVLVNFFLTLDSECHATVRMTIYN